MLRIYGSENFPADLRNTAVTFGNFDGVHVGHQELIRRIGENARSSGGPSSVYTFEPHPVRILAPSQCPNLLTTLDQKLTLLESYGVNVTVVEPFTHEFSRLSPEKFFSKIIIERLRPSSIVIGYDFTFGLHRQGTIETLEMLGEKSGVEVTVIPAAFLGETLISSTVIRRMIVEGRVAEASKLLGRPYAIEGEVISGRGLGRSLAARTANLKSFNEIVPADGVYASFLKIEGDDRPLASVTSIGDNPTFSDAHYSIETHVLDGEIDVIGKAVSIHFLSFMRETLKFATVDELKAQIGRDIEAAREYHSSHQ